MVRQGTVSDVGELAALRSAWTLEDSDGRLDELGATTRPPSPGWSATASCSGRWTVWLAEIDGAIVSHAFVGLIDKIPRPIARARGDRLPDERVHAAGVSRAVASAARCSTPSPSGRATRTSSFSSCGRARRASPTTSAMASPNRGEPLVWLHPEVAGLTQATMAPTGRESRQTYGPAAFTPPRPRRGARRERAVSRVRGRVSAADARVSESALPLVLAALHETRGEAILLVAPEDEDARDAAEAVAWYVDPARVALLPSRGVGIGSGLEPPAHLVGERARALAVLAAGGFVAASARALAEGMPPEDARPAARRVSRSARRSVSTSSSRPSRSPATSGPSGWRSEGRSRFAAASSTSSRAPDGSRFASSSSGTRSSRCGRSRRSRSGRCIRSRRR